MNYELSSEKLLTCLLQTCYNNLLQHCHDSLGTSRSTSCYKSVNKLLQVRHNKLLSAVRRHLVDKLLVQTCYKSAAGLLQVVRFYACTVVPIEAFRKILTSSFPNFEEFL
jgi:hypothetical protein